MQIICPNCSSENKIEYEENIICSDCKKSLAGHTYKRFKKPLISATAALFIGAYGAHKIDKEFIEDSRYPVGVEYELIDGCINASRNFMNSVWRVDKTKICVCALEKAMEDISYKDMKKSEPEFLTRFSSSIASCH
jgi:hypothetical protein